ncbi:MAG TPA: insulinase family protein, partial [Flavisolibacter sp.]
LVEDKKVTAGPNMSNRGSELAGQAYLTVRAFADKDLDEVAAAIREAFAKFEKEGISEKDLSRIKARQETQFYNSLSSVLGKGSELAHYSIFAGDPGFIEKDIRNIQSVTIADVKRVYEKYIKGKNYVATSFVPKGKAALALEGSAKAEVVEEKIVQGAEDAVDPTVTAVYERTPSSFDRSKEPPFGKTPEIRIPTIWKDQLANGMKVYGIQNNEVPLVQMEIVIDGGLLLEDINKVGVSNLMARMMTQGTRRKTPAELQEAIQQLGATINVSAGTEDVTVSVNTLARNYAATLALVEEILLEPRWDAKEFALQKQSVVNAIRQQEANPNAVAQNNYALLVYGKDNIRSRSNLGTVESVNAITIEDLQAFYNKSISPSVARTHVVGALGKSAVLAPMTALVARWKSKPVNIPAHPALQKPQVSQVYFYDIPDAKQSVIRIGYPALAATHPDYYKASVMNYILGGGGFASRLTQQLREGKGYTYGITSGFSGTAAAGPFTIGSSVRTNVTLESAQEIKKILKDYAATFTQADLETTKSSLIKSNARAFETANAKLNMLQNISKYGWKPDYVKERENIVAGMTVEGIRALANQYLDADKMIWMIAGDAKTQLPRLKELGFGEPVLLSQKSF